ncbi:MAG: hypothetical protein COV52_06935 [Gammaproteobacteria bacterium CG11_big_fil_rev_8_21_14_0_20_46_22]|nr:MAG: hypothetical protein COW05_06340 [Gammaproteobacteria bacterium CG12_big_fil_rev_8_21_14_0_65_46_12]PIR10775.1 MAG: hypothetical protein COV52_06935 [Gammaproteobacteria bacterium CG11_big_fil_rev_8_21_14_0_20_46_22]
MCRLWVLLFSLSLSCVVFAVNLASPIGYWKQYDDHTGKLQSIMQIYKADDGTFSGRIITGFKINGKAPNLYCTKCGGKYHNHRLAGLTIMSGLHQTADDWEGGHIFDPNSGHLYKVKMHLTKGGHDLAVRGYIGFSLLGRTQTWVRVMPGELKALMEKAYPQPKSLYKP